MVLEAQYFGPAVFDPNEKLGNRDIPGVGGVVFLNSSIALNVAKRATMRLAVDNILDQAPPYPSPSGPANGDDGTVTYFSGILGRYYKISMTTRF